ncbi:MAG: carotenoid oxygenase, partial [Actinobacteria bacterium]|nr:carotenoid oxygenase [Actinomycetota bacterium]
MTTNNPWISGPFAPVGGETTAVDLEVIGTIPSDLDGRYLRNGPNPITPIDPANHHWFLGDAMVHGVSLRDGQAEWYRSR